MKKEERKSQISLRSEPKPGPKRRRTRLVIGVGAIVVVLVIAFYLYLRNRGLSTIYVGGARLRVETRDTPTGRRRGLMYRKRLPRNQGMLFIFEEPDLYSFWMKNTYIPLSIAFVSEEMEIVQIDSMSPLDVLNRHFPEERVKYAIEVNQGWFHGRGVRVGNVVKGINGINVQ